MSSIGRYLMVFAVVLGVVLLGASVAPAVLSSSSGPVGDAQSPAQYQPSNLRLNTVPETGTIEVGGPTETKTIAIDVGHGNSITRKELTPLISALVEAGHEVEFVGGEAGGISTAGGSGFNATLQNADAFIVATPRAQFTATQVKAIEAYAEGGGRVLFLEDAPVTRSTSSIVTRYGGDSNYRLGRLGSHFGIAFGTSYLYDVTHNATNFEAVFATPDGGSELVDGVDRAVFREAVPIKTGSGASPVLTTAPDTRLESTRESGTYTVLARNGNVVAVGDTTFLTPGSYREADNEVLIGNIATFLVSGDKDPCVPRTRPAIPDRPPRPPRQPIDGNTTQGNGNTTIPSGGTGMTLPSGSPTTQKQC